MGRERRERVIEHQTERLAPETLAGPRYDDPAQLDRSVSAGQAGKQHEADGLPRGEHEQMCLIAVGQRQLVGFARPAQDEGRGAGIGLGGQHEVEVGGFGGAQRQGHRVRIRGARPCGCLGASPASIGGIGSSTRCPFSATSASP